MTLILNSAVILIDLMKVAQNEIFLRFRQRLPGSQSDWFCRKQCF